MILETLIICSLISNAPYYDCNVEWTIFIYDGDAKDYCSGNLACAIRSISPNLYDGEIHIDAKYNKILIGKSGIYRVYAEVTDRCGNNVLWHELQHLVTRDRNNCH